MRNIRSGSVLCDITAETFFAEGTRNYRICSNVFVSTSCSVESEFCSSAIKSCLSMPSVSVSMSGLESASATV